MLDFSDIFELLKWPSTKTLREEYQYFLISLAKVFVDPEDELRIKISDNVRKTYLNDARTCMDALMEMEMAAHARVRVDKPKRIKVPGRFRRKWEVAA